MVDLRAMFSRASAAGLSVATLVLALVACSSSTPAPAEDYGGSCALLSNRCHPVKTALGKECHDLGHDGDDAKCGPRKAECLAECPEGAGDAGHEADATPTTDAATDAADAGNDGCTTYCACMTATCATESSYPYADEAGCLAACKGFDQKGLTCVTAACEKAKTASDKAHECEHAGSPTGCH